jgi:hypothetical protein
MKRSWIVVFLVVALSGSGCLKQRLDQPQSSSGVTKATVAVNVGSDGLTVEQRAVADRLKVDNLPGAIKHLYVMSPFTGKILLYSTVRGKVTSGSKRLTPSQLTGSGQYYGDAMKVNIGGSNWNTAEVLGDDGTYGESVRYVYWWDSAGRYHQQFGIENLMVHVSDYPIAIPADDIVINIDAVVK